MQYRRCLIGAVLTMMLYYCTIIVPKRLRDSVSGDVSFRIPTVELLVVTMHSGRSPVTRKVLAEAQFDEFGLKIYKS